VRERWVEGVRGVRARSSRTLAGVQQDDDCGSDAHGDGGGMDSESRASRQCKANASGRVTPSDNEC
jgi:hypothetical protein